MIQRPGGVVVAFQGGEGVGLLAQGGGVVRTQTEGGVAGRQRFLQATALVVQAEAG